jgi:hypothetical protein
MGFNKKSFIGLRGVYERVQEMYDIDECMALCGVAVDVETAISVTAMIWSNGMNPEDLLLDYRS